MPHVIAIGNSKGGVGKTTTTLALASNLASEGYKTLILDADNNQHSIEEFHDSGFIDFDLETIGSSKEYNNLPKLIDLHAYDFILIDTSPHSHAESLFAEILEDADTVLTVIKPSPKDYFAFKKIMAEILNDSLSKNPNQKQHILINMVKPLMSKSQKESIEAIHELDFNVLNTMLKERVYFETLGLEKRSDPKAELEIKEIIEELKLIKE